MRLRHLEHALTRPWLALIPLSTLLGCSDEPPPVEPTPTILPSTPIPETPTQPASSPSPTIAPTLTPTLTPSPSPSPTQVPTPTLAPGVAILDVSSLSLEFGNVLIAQSSSLPLTLHNLGDAPLEVEIDLLQGSESFSYDLSQLPEALAPETSGTVTITFTPLQPLSAEGLLVLSSNDPEQPEVTVTLSGTGVEPLPDDQDGDGAPTGEDCNDLDPNTYPGAEERCDGLDNDCDGIDEDAELGVLYLDVDGDGFGDNDTAFVPEGIVCQAPTGTSAIGGDCSDANATVYPGAREVCDALDNDCDGNVDEEVISTVYADADGDGHGDVSKPIEACAAGPGTSILSDDCDDTDASKHPGKAEQCDLKDNDCNTLVDDGLPQDIYYADEDEDGYGNALDPVSSCGAFDGRVNDETDCDDTRADVHPQANEACDGIDNDCDLIVDEEGRSTYYYDEDGDGYGDPTRSEETCAPDAQQVSNNADCDDADPAINPSAEERCDNIDNNCNTLLDEGVTSTFYNDADQDGYGNDAATAVACSAPAGYVSQGGDCNDAEPVSYPGNAEVCDLKDNDCDKQIDEGVTSTYYGDADGDGHGSASAPAQACAAGNGLVASSDDCNDGDPSIYAGNTETCDLKDNDCDGSIDEGVQLTYYQDADEDGFGNAAKPTQACKAPAGYVSNSTDCNDKNQDVYPGAAELCNSKDDDCDSQVDESVTTAVYKDGDGDSYGDPNQKLDTCTAPSGYVGRAGDCNDAAANINPGATEICNTIDDDCDGAKDENVLLTFYQDIDGDGYGNSSKPTEACSAPSGYVSQGGDCNDINATVAPNAAERCDGLDNDCDGQLDENVGVTWYQDSDQDGFGNPSATTVACAQPTNYVSNNLDCNDSNKTVYPNATETCNNVDDDCDGTVDEGVKTTFYQDLDKDGYGNASVTTQACTAPTGYVSNNTDCKDTNDTINPGATEQPNGIDDDCDGQVDDGAYLTSCKAIKQAIPTAQSGIYTIDADGIGVGVGAFEVYCDMVTDGGGWMVIQRRQNGSVDFYRGWTDYRNGFGLLSGEFWLGLDKISLLTRTVTTTLRVDMRRYTGASYYASYSTFRVGDTTTDYILTVSGFSGSASDCNGTGSGMIYHSGKRFSTFDRDNDNWSDNCATRFKGAWWYDSCHYNNLNGIYYNGPHPSYADGVNWYCVTGYYEALTFSEMKIR